MTMKRTIGGQRLGSGNRMTADLKTYERSTHDLSYIWRSTMAPGTLVPFIKELALPGDTFDIDLDCDIMTHPTVGPLFGSYKVQLDVFQAPIRLYQGLLHNNKLGIGLNMAAVKLPQMLVTALEFDKTKPDTQQINPSCILHYLGIKGIGNNQDSNFSRAFNALPYLSYWDIYKNYYANKQEEIGAVIHNAVAPAEGTIDSIDISGAAGFDVLPQDPATTAYPIDSTTKLNINWSGTTPPNMSNIRILTSLGDGPANVIFGTETAGNPILLENPISAYIGATMYGWKYILDPRPENAKPKVYTFPLSNIDEVREDILMNTTELSAYTIQSSTIAPYGLTLDYNGSLDSGNANFPQLTPLEGLGLKTYQSDLFNNWIETEWLDGTNGINEITAIDTTSGSFTIDTLNLSKKVYDMLNRIAISGGTYDDWLDTVYTHERFQRAETPMYMGGLIKELVFEEIFSTAEAGGTDTQPLGTLAGKGRLSGKHKGGKIRIKVDEPSYIMGIISLTPRVDYSQGNKWDVHLKTMDDLHKPALDEIGFQDLITEQMAYWDTTITGLGGTITQHSAGKQPAWLNYMTNVNEVHGNFAIEDNEMFMTLNRKYEIDQTTGRIKDLTTYIDPVKFNDIFAQTSRDAQNFWTQIKVDIIARRKMSARIIPNL